MVENAMAGCPRCNAKQSYSSALLLIGRKSFPCEKCGTSLRVDEARLVPYLLVISSVAILIGASTMIAQHYLIGIVLLLVWAVIALAVYPLVLSLSTPGDGRGLGGGESAAVKH